MVAQTVMPGAGTSKAIDRFFKGYGHSLLLFRKLRSLLEKHGAPEITVSKTQIVFGGKYKFAWVWLPQRWIAKRSDEGIALTIATGNKLESGRIVESVLPRKGFWTHHILIGDEREIDPEIEALVKASYEFSLQRVRRKQSLKSKSPKKTHTHEQTT